MAAIVAEISYIFEKERYHHDDEVKREEAKSGMAPVTVDPSLKIDNFGAYSTQHLHALAGHLQFFKRGIDFQSDLITFLIQRHTGLTTSRKARLRDPQNNNEASTIDAAAQRIRRSLDLTLSFTYNRHKQVLELSNRITNQVRIVDNLIIREDSRTNIVLAQQSQQIARDTKKDSVAMKTIAALTMCFLPGTFVGVSFASEWAAGWVGEKLRERPPPTLPPNPPLLPRFR